MSSLCSIWICRIRKLCCPLNLDHEGFALTAVTHLHNKTTYASIEMQEEAHTYYRAHIRTGPQGICRSLDKGLGIRQTQ